MMKAICFVGLCKHNCEHKCNDKKAKCTCYPGYILSSDRFSCLKCATANFTSDRKEITRPSWNVAICGNGNISLPAVCSGTWLSDKWVITATDCVCGIGNTSNLVVKTGPCNANEKEAGYPVVEIKCYSKYKPALLNVNLALIKINTSGISTEQRHAIHPICPTNDKSKLKVESGDHIMFFGWGNIADSVSNSSTLKVSNVTVADKKECTISFYREGVEKFKGATVFCTYGNSTAYCNGNIGAGVVSVADNEYLLLKGVINRSTKDCGIPGSFIAHSRMSFNKVQRWIKIQKKL